MLFLFRPLLFYYSIFAILCPVDNFSQFCVRYIDARVGLSLGQTKKLLPAGIDNSFYSLYAFIRLTKLFFRSTTLGACYGRLRTGGGGMREAGAVLYGVPWWNSIRFHTRGARFEVP